MLKIYSIKFQQPRVPEKAGVVFFTHKSTLDAFFINLFHENVVTLTKVEFLLIPFFGVLAFVSPAVFIDRKDFRSGRRSLEVCGERVKEGGVVFVSPEGTRSKTGHLTLPLKKGPFHLLQSLHPSPLHLLIIRGGYEIWPPNRYWPVPGELEVEWVEVEGLRKDDREHNSKLITLKMSKHSSSPLQPSSGRSWSSGHFLGALISRIVYLIMKFGYVRIILGDGGVFRWRSIFYLHVLVLAIHVLICLCLYSFEKVRSSFKVKIE
ncbi:hypothetical protein TrLO_g157 [Triparma laevis f. longispina]|uniref:Phospholipid/glycerol acyltransferase domain-containing protein n=1 Tax=Triparma laevis f. longispina TaxID=1714387 RepID=A0A9W7DTT3_9STRA|nr:hypothetical protein TrLO_g157 [Triparma laevis f. longispina]